MASTRPLKWLLLILIAVSGCMTADERDLYQKISVVGEVITVTPTQYRWDLLLIEFPNGYRTKIRMPRDMYHPGDAYHKQMWKWQAIERNIL